MCDKADSFGVHMILLSHAFVCGFEGFCGFWRIIRPSPPSRYQLGEIYFRGERLLL
jgi:hypothetical protein